MSSSGVEFEEDSFARSYSQPGSNSSSNSYSYGNTSEQSGGMAGWLIRHHIVKSSQGAQLFLVGVIIINIVITVVALIYYL